ncbi:MAG: hypothetical protein RQ862_11450 [Candidatus Caldarchaeales archaeon]|nr:hypothetical protein [Candidatus Caldarchaeales archaeon]
MTQWQQIAQQESVIFKPVSLPKVRFTEIVAEPVRAFALLVFGGKTLWFRPDSNTLIEVSYRAPYYKIVSHKEGAPHLEISFTPEAEKVIELLRKYVAYLAE